MTDIVNCYDIDSIIREVEIALQIDGKDYEETDIDVALDSIKERLMRKTQIDFKRFKLTAPEVKDGVYRPQTIMFVSSMALVHSKLAGLTHIQRYLTSTPLSLPSINYMGYTESSMRTLLLALQRKATMPRAEDAVKAIKEQLSVIENCREKRLFMVIIVAYEIGLLEIVSIVAEMLYQSMMKEKSL